MQNSRPADHLYFDPSTGKLTTSRTAASRYVDLSMAAENLYFDPSTRKLKTSRPADELYFDPATGKLSTSKLPNFILMTKR